MLKNDPKREILAHKARLDLSWTDIAERMGAAYRQSPQQMAECGSPSSGFIRLAEALECDVEVKLIPRPHDPKQFVWKVSPGRKYRGKGTEET